MVVLRVVEVAACFYGIWWSWKLARADYLFRRDNPASLRAAICLVPIQPAYYLRLAQLDGVHAGELLEAALRLNRYNASAAIELGLRFEADGDYPRAEKMLLAAWVVDRTWLPRWSLANYYFRRDNMPAFWFWARQAARMPAADITPLFQLCWRVTPDAASVAKEVLPDDPDSIRQFIGFLLSRDQVLEVAAVAPRLLRYGNAETDRPLLLTVVNRLISANDGAAAVALWNLMAERRWVVADASAPNNATFSRPPLAVAFDWTLPSYDGLGSWPGPSGLEAEFSGRQPENCVIAEQTVALAPGSYGFRYAYRTSEIAPGTGIVWRILDVRSGAILAVSPGLASDTLQRDSVEFQVTPATPLVRLRLVYNRALGTPRISGMLAMISTGIVAGGAQDLPSAR